MFKGVHIINQWALRVGLCVYGRAHCLHVFELCVPITPVLFSADTKLLSRIQKRRRHPQQPKRVALSSATARYPEAGKSGEIH